MAESVSNVLSYSELEVTIRTFDPSKIDDLGTLGWYQAHERMQKLSQQAIIEVRNGKEENVIGLLSTHDKVSVLVHEAICIQVWREKVLPEILSSFLDESAHGFMPYLIMFHEATAVSLLETILFDSEACVALGDSVIDLLDYVAFSLAVLVGSGDHGSEVLSVSDIRTQTVKQQLETQQRDMAFSIGLRCVSLVRYLATNLDSLPVGAATRMFETHDLPVMLAALREAEPWTRNNSQGETVIFEGEQWRTESSKTGCLPRTESQLWLALHQLLLSPQCAAHYEITSARQAALGKLQRFLHETVLDQLSPLLELKHWLGQASVASLPPAPRKSVILEMLPEIRAGLLKRSGRQWKQLAQDQAQRMFGKELMVQVARGMSATYDLDLLDKLQPTVRRCSSCGDETTQRCSRCKTFYYCCRACQVREWKKHKTHCDKIVRSD